MTREIGDNLSVTGTLTIDGASTLIGDVSASGDVTVTGDVKKLTSSGNDAKLGGALYGDSGTHANTTTGDTTLATYNTVPAATLSINDQELVFEGSGSFINNANAKTIRAKFGSQTLSAMALPTSQVGLWRIKGWITRTSATAQDYFVEMIVTDGAGGTGTIWGYQAQGTLTQTLANALELKITGQGGATNDIKQERFKVYWEPANT